MQIDEVLLKYDNIMFTINDLEHYEQDFRKIGIDDTDMMLGILNTLNEVAEITYYVDKNKIKYD